jgi:hypothetical protein
MKFIPFHPPGSLKLLDARANILAAGCRHCHRSDALGPHGFLRGNPPTGNGRVIRGLRFFCSDRYSHGGCGRTFSVLWNTVIPGCSLRTAQLLELMRAVSADRPTHGAWWHSKLTISLSGAYRWVAKWLGLVTPPPGKSDGLPDPLTLRHLAAAFPAADCAIAAFQGQLQVPITG